LERAVKGMQATGQKITSARIDKEGNIIVSCGEADKAAAEDSNTCEWDEVLK
jgi:hypothetical protein